MGEDGNSIKVNLIKQDDGGSPIKHYLVKYRAVSMSQLHSLLPLWGTVSKVWWNRGNTEFVMVLSDCKALSFCFQS